MITVDVVVFVALIAATLIIGAVLSFRVYGVNSAQGNTIRCALRDAAVNDEAERGSDA